MIMWQSGFIEIWMEFSGPDEKARGKGKTLQDEEILRGTRPKKKGETHPLLGDTGLQAL